MNHISPWDRSNIAGPKDTFQDESKGLTIGTLHTILRCDPETGKLYWKPLGREHFKSDRAYSRYKNNKANKEVYTSVDSRGYVRLAIHCKLYSVHRVVWALVHYEWPGCIDHINQNRTDNRYGNLRTASFSENSQNRKLSANNSSGVMGVYWKSREQTWAASIMVKRTRIYLGKFGSREEAIAARRAAEIEHGFHPNHGRAA